MVSPDDMRRMARWWALRSRTERLVRLLGYVAEADPAAGSACRTAMWRARATGLT